jgi:ribA/ribD-fused uncharacterized protein
LSIENVVIKEFLMGNNIQLTSKVIYSCVRDEDGQFTKYRNGDRFVYCKPFDPPLSKEQTIADNICTITHHGKDMACKSCEGVGHRSGDGTCPAKAAEGSVLAFSSHQHPLSTQFLNPVNTFGDTFESVEHAFYWKAASELNEQNLAKRIKGAQHAGVVRRLKRELDEEELLKWEKDHVSIMKDIIRNKYDQCIPFRNCLTENQGKTFACCSSNKFWATGLPATISTLTSPKFWKGENVIGRILTEIAEEKLASSPEELTAIPTSTPESNPRTPHTIGHIEDCDAEEISLGTGDEIASENELEVETKADKAKLERKMPKTTKIKRQQQQKKQDQKQRKKRQQLQKPQKQPQ